MTEEREQDGLTEAELSDLARKIKAFGQQLTPRERWFLAESLKSGIVANRVGEIEGFTLTSALEGDLVFRPGLPQPIPTNEIFVFE
jgi:hypothetical protein